MNILYLNTNSILETTGKILRQRGHVVFFRTACADALELLRRQSLDAIVIEDEEENAEILDFTARAHRTQPAAPVYLANDWGPDLPSALEEFVKAGEALHTSSTASMQLPDGDVAFNRLIDGNLWRRSLCSQQR